MAVFLIDARRKRRSLDQMAWLAWCAGFPITPRIRGFLKSRYTEGLHTAEEGLAAFERGDPGNPIDAAENTAARGFRRIARQFRSTVARVGFEAIAGRFDASQYTEDDLAVFTARSGSARDDTPIEGELAWIVNSLFGMMNQRTALDAVQRLSDAQLEADRDFALAFSSHALPGVGPTLYFGIFELVFMLRRVSGPGRLAIRHARREGRKRGFTTLAAFYDHLLATAHPPDR